MSVDNAASGCSFVVYGGDALISHCIWSAGYGMTQPIQSYFKPHVQMFDLGRWERRPLMNLLVDATEGNCNELCQAQVGLHIIVQQVFIHWIHQPAFIHCIHQQALTHCIHQLLLVVPLHVSMLVT